MRMQHGSTLGTTILLSAWLLAFGAGCSDDGGGAVDTSNIGDNNPEVYLALGDSLITGVGGVVPYPGRLGALKGKSVVNAGRNGSTASAGASRLGSLLAEYQPAIVLVSLGTNDAIQGVDPSATIGALQSIVAQCEANQSKVVVANVMPMFESRALYNGNVKAINDRMGEVGAPVVNLYKDFKGKEELTLDGLHPNDQGAQVMALAFGDKV